MAITGDRLLALLAALASPQRLRIVAALKADGRNYVSQLARDVGISRPLLHLHLQKLEEAGLVTSKLELSGDAYRPVSEELRSQGVSEARPLDFHTPYGCSKGAATAICPSSA